MAQNQTESPGFALPQPQTGPDSAPPGPSASARVSAPGKTGTETSPAPIGTEGAGSDTSSRDLLVGGGIWLILLIAFFFAKNAYANTLVGKRVPPAKANAAGWWLFIFLSAASTGVILGAVNPGKFMVALVMGPIILVGLVALVLALLTGRK